METPQNAETEEVTVRTFRPGSYEPAIWTVVQTQVGDDAFQPSTYERGAKSRYVVDPMFADFDAEPSGPVSAKDEAPFEALSGKVVPEDPEGIADLSATDSVGGEEHNAPSDDYLDEVSSQNDSSYADSAQVFETPSDGEPMLASSEETTSLESDSESQSAEVVSLNADEVTALREQAYAEGLAAGQSELVEAKAQLEARYEELFADMQTQVKEALRNAERQAVELSFQVAQKLIGTVLESDRSYIQEVIAQALQAAAGSEVIRIRVSPQDFDFLSLSNLAAAIQAKSGGDWKFEPDDSIRAGCVVATKAGEIDFNLDASWARMRDKVLRGPKS